MAAQRPTGHEPEVAVIHRPRYDDWSLPKGKVDPGETEPVTAVREVHEETGYSSQSRPAADVGQLSGRTQGIKKVRYWAARVVDGEFTPNDEVDELIWLPVADGDEAAPVRRTTGRCCAGSPSIPPTPRRC